jgi:hypothetical protein
MKKLPMVALAFVFLSGCAAGATFVYKPSAPAAGGPKLPLKIAVLSFRDGTEDWQQRGSIFDPETVKFNLAKGVMGGWITALTPELWSKAFADDMAASGAFRSVRFYFSPSELTDEDFFIEGTVEKAYSNLPLFGSNEYALGLRAMRRTDKNPAWDKEVARAWTNNKTQQDGCGLGVQCAIDRVHADFNRVMQGMFAEAREDLVGKLGALSGNRVGEEAVPSAGAPSPAAAGSADEELERILKGK